MGTFEGKLQFQGSSQDWMRTREEESKDIEDGFDYVKKDKDGASLYRKADSQQPSLLGTTK